MSRPPDRMFAQELQIIPPKRDIARWLFCLCGFIALIVVVGGTTRLTDSGLSITEWQPVTGVVPPLDQPSWEAEFAKYKQIPEYTRINKGMSLAEFKRIYWWEWLHRLLGRMAGVLFLVPFLYFLWRKRFSARDIPHMLTMFALGGAQGALGWYMVKSGLVDRVDVSQYRLAAHLGMAFFLYGYIFWIALGYLHGSKANRTQITVAGSGSLIWLSKLLCLLVFLQVLLGALVAGLDAGLTYNSWPLMDGRWIPKGLWLETPAYLNLFENITMVQFNHRVMAAIIALVALWSLLAGFRAHVPGRVKASILLTACVVAGQFALGIWTLIAVVPFKLAILHQLGALLLLSVTLIQMRAVRQWRNGRALEPGTAPG